MALGERHGGADPAGEKPGDAVIGRFMVGQVVMFGDGCRGPGVPCLVLTDGGGNGTYTVRQPADEGDTYAEDHELRRATMADIAEWLKGGP